MSDCEKPVLRSANDNPWYCLATMHGEQPTDRIDLQLAGKNWNSWQLWIDGGMNDSRRQEFMEAFAVRNPELLPPDRASTTVDFSRTHFERPVAFTNGFKFMMPANFSGAKFSGKTEFKDLHFLGGADFSSASFCGDTSFRGVHCRRSINFQSATFSNKVDFRGTYLDDPDFSSATFSGLVNFNGAHFLVDKASFGSATFSSFADFTSATFRTVADFGSVSFSGTNFTKTTFEKRVTFNAANFSSSILFRNAVFDDSAIFAEVRFGGEVPDFRGAEMHAATEWHGVHWPKPTRSNAQQQVYGYERLKQEMEKLKKHEDEQNFFRMELRARRALVPVLSGRWLLNLLYQLLSGYGNSIIRPLLWLLGVFAVGTAIFSCTPSESGAPMPIMPSSKLSAANILWFMPTARQMMVNQNVVLSDTAQVVSVAQSLASVALVFLLGLGLRNRFRMK